MKHSTLPYNRKTEELGISNLEAIYEVMSSGGSGLVSEPNSVPELMVKQAMECKTWLNEAKRFEIGVEKSQVSYDDLYSGKKEKSLIFSNFKNFRLPFDTTTIGFRKELVVKWSEKENRRNYVDMKLLGVLIKKMFDDKISLVDNFDTPVGASGYVYRAYLFFNEGVVEVKGKENIALSHQYIDFIFGEPLGENTKGVVVHIDHYPCQDEKHCSISKGGDLKDWAKIIDHKPVCQEILARDSLIETLVEIVNKINTSERVEVKKKVGNGHPIKPLPHGFPYTKGNLPKDHYTQYIDGIHRVYDKDEIALGMGIKHRYRYDVRRHPRIINDKIVWVDSHTRGSGSYIPKIYKNRGTWFVQYLFYVAERLSKHRTMEIVLIKLITVLRKAIK